MHLDPILPTVVGSAVLVPAVGLAMRALRQPVEVGYLLAGVFLGPEVFGVFEDLSVIERAGGFGVVLLLFFADSSGRLPMRGDEISVGFEQLRDVLFVSAQQRILIE